MSHPASPSPTGSLDIDPATAPCKQDEVGTFARYFGPAVFSVAFVVGLAGNGLVLAVLGRRRCPWPFADGFLFQLAVADLLLVLSLPFWATQFTQPWPFGEALCKLLGALSTLNGYSTAFLLACLSVERCLLIGHPTWLHRHVRPSHVGLCSALLWGLALGLSSVELHFRSVGYTPQAGAVTCHLGFGAREADSWRLGLRLAAFLVGFLLPLLVMALCYCRIVARLRRAQLPHRRPAVRLLAAIVALFALSWGPYHGFVLVDSLERLGHLARDCAREKVLDFGLLFTESLGLLHCCLNPVVYAFLGAKFRRELSRLSPGRGGHWSPRDSQALEDFSRATEPSTAQAGDGSVML
uniref:G-protein coupled receptors family 1 profile domain-containing protein n=1 Tax=Varanus komodoensis TaxID=61221 RepID=A0A8D2L985_VARKO